MLENKVKCVWFIGAIHEWRPQNIADFQTLPPPVSVYFLMFSYLYNITIHILAEPPSPSLRGRQLCMFPNSKCHRIPYFFCEFKVPQIALNLVYCTKMNSLCELLGPQNESPLHYLANTRLLQRKFRTISPPQKGRSKNRNWNYYINTLYRVFCWFGNGFNSISWLHFTSDFNDRTLHVY